VDAPAWAGVERRFNELYKPGDAAIAADARSLFSLFFAANYQRAVSRSPEKTWSDGGLASERTTGCRAPASF
jgi:hypothetical protein